ncbi:MAG TPA: hypothetical protein VK503_05245, partial [Candidatus Bathyarchaeia archaeon]|nr:hypothetical protein [Candidatus Bathyarchaeia archaeon]
FYKHIEHIGYFFTALGLFSGADLILQVFIHQLYNEARWWIEVLLVTFGVLSFAIFGSLGRIGAQEEREMALRIQQTTQTADVEPESSSFSGPSDVAQIPAVIEVRLADFVKSPSGDFERRLSERVYDMIRIQPDMISIWREERQEIRAVYLAGPYELTRESLEEHLKRGEELKVGIVSLPIDVIQDLLKPQSPTAVSA